MDVVDELTTPGCPNCAIKHMSAAIMHAALGHDECSNPVMTWCARAFINLVEAVEGYRSHFDFAIGCLVSAEEDAVIRGDKPLALDIRSIRCELVSGDHDGVAMDKLRGMSLMSMASGHQAEAYRELPELSERFPQHIPLRDQMYTDYAGKIVAWIYGEYFTVEDVR